MLSRQDVLIRTNAGRDVFQHYLAVEPKAGRNFQNPFTEKQQTPSFNLFQDAAGEWRYHDFATGDKGTWLDLVMNLHQLTLPEALAHIVEQLGVIDNPSGTVSPMRSSIPLANVPARPFLAAPRDYTPVEIEYWGQYGIGIDALKKYDVQALESYTASRADGTQYTISSQVNNPLFAYNAGDGFVKVYAPLTRNKAHKFTWPTGKPPGYAFGFEQLNARQPIILLAAGEKDALALSSHGYPAVTVGSENALIPAELMAELKSRSDEVLICYDSDDTGRTRAAELSAEHGVRWVELPRELKDYGKDVADFYRAVYQKHLPANLLDEAIQQAHTPFQAVPESLPAEAESAEHNPPLFPTAVYENVPAFLQRACAPFDGHEKDVMLLSTIGILSGCFSGVQGVYDQRRFGLNLFTFICAPAASGKGTMLWAQRIARPYHKQLISESNARISAYKADLQAHKSSAKGGTVPHPTSPMPPKQMLFLPGDTTAAALMQNLAGNDGRGIICESEADTLASAMGGEHGKFGDKLCKIFQHEPVPLMRKAESLYLDIERPAVSIVLTGTPAQLPRLMPNAENGLMSRFLFYSFQRPYTCKSCAPNGQPPLAPYFDGLGQELLRMIMATPSRDVEGLGGVEFTLSPTDWQRLDAAGEAGLQEAIGVAGGAGASTAFRLGLIAFRLIGLLTVLRCFENGEALTGQIQADAQDVTAALLLVETARAHALHVLVNQPRASKVPQQLTTAAEKADKIARAHELKGKGMTVRQIADEIGKSPSTIQDWLTPRRA